MTAKEKHPPSVTRDCPYCGSTYFGKDGNTETVCACGCALVTRPPGQPQGDFVLYLQICRRDAEGTPWWDLSPEFLAETE